MDIDLSDIWTFCSSSEVYLQSFIAAAAATKDTNNKWSRKFGKNSVVVILSEESDLIDDNKPEEAQINEEETVKTKEYESEDFETLVHDPLEHFQEIQHESTKNPSLIIHLAEKLPTNTIEKIFNLLLTDKNLDTNFLDLFFVKFLKTYLHRDCTWFSVDLLLKTHRHRYPQFRKVLPVILKELAISSKLFQDFVHLLAKEEKETLLNIILNIELSSEEFVYHLPTLFSMYKDCQKTQSLQNYVLESFISPYKDVCSTDRTFGRFLLTFLQTQKDLQSTTHIRTLQKLLDTHKSPFRRPCMNILSELCEIYK